MKAVTEYIREVCGKAYATENEALQCEKQCMTCISKQLPKTELFVIQAAPGISVRVEIDFEHKVMRSIYYYRHTESITQEVPITHCPFCGEKLE